MKTTSTQILKSAVDGKLELSSMNLTKIPSRCNILKNVKVMDLNNNNIKQLDVTMLPPNLEMLLLSYNKIETLDLTGCPKSLKQLYINNNKLNTIDLSKSCLNFLSCSSNNLVSLGELPDSLEILICSKNKITHIDDLKNVKQILCQNNKMKDIRLKKTIGNIDISYNPLEEIRDIPNDINMLVLKGTNLKDIKRIDKNVLFIRNCIGLPDKIKKSFYERYVVLMQSRIRGVLERRKYRYKQVIRDIDDISRFNLRTNPKLLSVYFKKPASRVALSVLK